VESYNSCFKANEVMSVKMFKGLSLFGFTSSRGEKLAVTVLNANTNNNLDTIEAGLTKNVNTCFYSIECTPSKFPGSTTDHIPQIRVAKHVERYTECFTIVEHGKKIFFDFDKIYWCMHSPLRIVTHSIIISFFF